MDIKKIIKEVILEDVATTASIKGSDADTALARGEYLRDKAMQNLSDLGVYGAKGHMASLGIFDEEYLSKSGPFKLSFTTKGGSPSSGMAKYDKSLSKKENTIVLSFKSDKPICFNQNECYQFFKIKFSPESTHRAYMQKFKVKFGVGPLKYGKEESKGLRGLQEGYVFDVTIIPYGKSRNVSGGLEKQKYSRSFKKGLTGQQTKINFPPENVGSKNIGASQETPEISQIKRDLELLKTSGGVDKSGNKFPQQVIDRLISQKQKELDDLLKQQKNPGEQLSIFDHYFNSNTILTEAEGDIIKTQIKINNIGLQKPSDLGKRDKLSKDKFTKVRGSIDLPDEKKNLFDVTTLDKISDYLKKGVFYAKISEKNKNNIILSDSPTYDNKSQYVVLQSKEDFDTSNPLSWKGKSVRVGKNAMGRDEFPTNIKGVINNLEIVD